MDLLRAMFQLKSAILVLHYSKATQRAVCALVISQNHFIKPFTKVTSQLARHMQLGLLAYQAARSSDTAGRVETQDHILVYIALDWVSTHATGYELKLVKAVGYCTFSVCLSCLLHTHTEPCGLGMRLHTSFTSIHVTLCMIPVQHQYSF